MSAYRFEHLSSTYMVSDEHGRELGLVEFNGAFEPGWMVPAADPKLYTGYRGQVLPHNKVYPTREAAAAALVILAESNGAGGKEQG